MRRFGILIVLLLTGCQGDQQAKISDLSADIPDKISHIWPVPAPLSQPDGLRPCCAFGYDLKAELLGVPVPFYHAENVADADQLGDHVYNNSELSGITNLMGMSSENLGLLYTRRAGFIDIAHIRDTADNTLFLFSQIWPRLGEEWQLELGTELTSRRIQFRAFTPPKSEQQRYILATFLAARLAYQMAVWHEIAQWYGYQSVFGFSEQVSAFSPEDLYSNMIGAKLSATLILSGRATSLDQYNSSMMAALPQVLHQLGAVNQTETRLQFDYVDGTWWDSKRYLPQKFLLLLRDYQTGNERKPMMVPGENMPAASLALPTQFANVRLADIAELQMRPGKLMENLPVPKSYYTSKDFSRLAQYAERQDAKQLLQNKRN